MPARSILHVDMDAFFASVEQRDRPELAGRPVLVGGDGPRGVVAAASYEAREYGCRSAQPMAVAKRLCPDAVIVAGRFSAYREASEQVFGIFESFTPTVEPLSIDEAFLDLTGTDRLHGDAVEVARRIKTSVTDTVHLTASVGVAPNKFLAKLASAIDKPDGLTVVDERWIANELPGQPIDRMWGVGPATAGRLESLGVRTFGDLASLDAELLESRLGSDATRLQTLARGEDHRRVVTTRQARSISHEQTFGVDQADRDAVRRVLMSHTESVARRLRRQQVRARTVTVKIRYGDFQTITRSTTLDDATDRTDLLWQAATMLFDAWCETGFRPVRLIGMGASHLESGSRQLDLFGGEDRLRRVDEVSDEIEAKFGRGTIQRLGGS